MAIGNPINNPKMVVYGVAAVCFTVFVNCVILLCKKKNNVDSLHKKEYELEKDIKVGIGFATGRKSFQKVLKMNVYNWQESGLTEKERIQLNLFVAYDLKYSNTKVTDYTQVNAKVLRLIDNAYFIGSSLIQTEMEDLLAKGILTPYETKLFFTSGYAAKRNAILYLSVKAHMNYLIFLDDDEYPMAVTNTRSTALWGGQHVLTTHLKHIRNADITNGHHCGYISPIPYIAFNHILTEQDFRVFIEALSNDILNWDTIQSVMENKGVTYADKDILVSDCAVEVQECKGTKFISGSNLCINLTDPARIHPFYNPPKARGEDTFLSTCLSANRIMRVPCYTFHDAFNYYTPLMDGVLPISLKHIKAESEAVITRFYKACIGWIRYKPLLLYITQPNSYEERIAQMRKNLSFVLPKICAYFHNNSFMEIMRELEHYHKHVKKHYLEFIETQNIWNKLQKYLKEA